MAKVRKRAGSTETIVSWTIMTILAVIAVGLWMKQSRYDPAVFRIPPPVRNPSDASVLGESGPEKPAPEGSSSRASSAMGASALMDLASFLPSEMKALSPPESFSDQTLSDKIDGKAELYLSAGFVNLRCRRFVRSDNPQSWMEIFVFDMGAHRQAFAVYSAQRRSEAVPADLAPFAYKTPNALYWVHGKYYVEAVASAPSEAMMEAMMSFARRFIQKAPAETAEMGEIGLFPADHLVEGSITLLSTDVFGLQGLENVYVARYQVNGEEMTAFLSKAKDTHEARMLTEAYRAFLLENGGVEVASEAQIPNVALIKIMDSFEVIFQQGPYFAGVHEAESRKVAEELACALSKKLTGVLP